MKVLRASGDAPTADIGALAVIAFWTFIGFCIGHWWWKP